MKRIIMGMLKGELTIDQARALVSKGRIIYVVVFGGAIVKVFDYHSEAFQYAKDMGNPRPSDIGYQLDGTGYYCAYNVSHAKCPRFVKFELGRLEQYDLFLDCNVNSPKAFG